MADKIQFRRGVDANIPTLDSGEPGLSTDTERVLVGAPGGNLELAVLDAPGGDIQSGQIPFGNAAGTVAEGNDQRLHFDRFTYIADMFESPANADWAVNALAPLAPDSNNGGLVVRLFDDATEEGVGFSLEVPAGAANVTLRIRGRAETAPGAAEDVILNLYERGIPDNAAPDAWSTGTALAAIGIPTNEFFQEDAETFTLAALGLTAGQMHQFELTRDGGDAGDTLTGDWALHSLIVEFA